MNNQYVYKENGFEIIRRDLNNKNVSDEENLINFINGISNKKNLDMKKIINLLLESFNETNKIFINSTISANKEFIDITNETNKKILKVFK